MGKKPKNRSVAPIYALGLTVLGYSLLFTLGSVGDYIKCALLAWVVYLLVGGIVKKDRPAQEAQAQQAPPRKDPPKQEPPKQDPPKQEDKPAGDPELEALLRRGREAVRRIQELNDAIPDYRMSAKLKQIEILTSSILSQVEKKPDKRKSVRQFMDYYLPTTIKLLEQYVNLQEVGLPGENITTGMERIEAMLDKVIVAFQKQLDGLFARDVVDITADIQVMEQMMAQNGLTNQRDFLRSDTHGRYHSPTDVDTGPLPGGEAPGTPGQRRAGGGAAEPRGAEGRGRLRPAD